MQRIILITTCLTCAATVLPAQDMPVFTQKLTNAFLYNPSNAGNARGSVCLSRRQYWTGVQGSPNTSLLSAHLPINGYRFGTGLTLYQDNVGITQTFSANGAFAYHMILPDRRSFSMGVAAEYYSYRVVPGRIDVQAQGWDDPALVSQHANVNGVDFSAGVSYYAQHLRLGASANRISGWLHEGHGPRIFYPFFSGFAQGVVPLDDKRHVIEPVLSYRSLSAVGALLEGGLYYTFNKRITFGASYRTGKVITAATSFQIYKNLTLGYAGEVITSQLNAGLGTSHEVVLRFDFNDRFDLSARQRSRYLNGAQMPRHGRRHVNYFVPKMAVKKYKRYVKKTRTISTQSIFEWRAKQTPRKKRMTIRMKKPKRPRN